MTTVSVVVPVYSGENYLVELVGLLEEVRTRWRSDYEDLELIEVVLVDDGSIDGSPTVLAGLSARHEWVQVLTLGRNFGQHPATIAGLLHCQGDWVATIDEDLQHRPAHIEGLLLRAVTESADVVYGLPMEPPHRSWVRDRLSRSFKRGLALLTGNRFVPLFGSFRVIRGPIARAASSVCGHETYFDVALTWYTDRFAAEKVEMVDTRYRGSGVSGYGISRLLSHARRLVMSSNPKVLRLAGAVGIAATLLAIFYGGRAVLQRVTGSVVTDIPGWASIFVGVMVFGALITLLLVLMLEYLIGIVLHTQGKPAFFVVDRSGDVGLLERLQVGRPQDIDS